jgi:hypothetical protein
MLRWVRILALLVFMTAQQSSFAQSPHKPIQSQGGAHQMSMGVLAITTDEAGTVFIDGVEGPRMTAGQVITEKLVAGQHFAEFHDEKGLKRWEKIITVPAGTQIAETIKLHSESQEEKLVSPTRLQGSMQSLWDNDPKLIADQVIKLIEASDTNFEAVKGPTKASASNQIEQWEVTVVVPGFQCVLNEFRNANARHVYCWSDRPADSGERFHLAIGQALSDNLVRMDYSCNSLAAQPSTISVNPVIIHNFHFMRTSAEMGIWQSLQIVTPEQYHTEPAGSYRIALSVYARPRTQSDNNTSPASCDFSYSALKSHELNTQAGAASTSSSQAQATSFQGSDLRSNGGVSSQRQSFEVRHMLQSGGVHFGELVIAPNQIEFHESTQRHQGNPEKDDFSVQCNEIKSIGKAGLLASWKGNSYGGSELRLDLFRKNYLFHALNDNERDTILESILRLCHRER